MWAILVAMIFVYLILIKSREHFLGVLPDALTVMKEKPFVTTEPNQSRGYEVYSSTPNTCPRSHPELQGGLCYTRCRSGFDGIGPVCWAQSHNVGIGLPVELEPCPDGWNNDGLTCREPIRNDCSWRGLLGECWGRLTGGRVKGRLDNGGVCPGGLEKVDGLCYYRCPARLPRRIPGMPYFCYAGGELSYGRGVGKIPPIVTMLDRSYSF